MQVIQITSLTGHSPYDITICDITNTYCYSGVTGATTAPLTIDIPTELLGTTELLVVVTDSIGCQEIQYHFCGEPIPSQTPTPTPTITPTNSICNCISIENTSGITLNFGFTQCDGLPFYGEIYSATTLYVCGSLPYGDSGVVITISSDICTGDVCPGPSPTPTTTPTPTPTLPPIVGYFEDSCDSSNQFTLSDIPISFNPLSGAYYIESSGFIGCATSVISSSTTNIYSFIAMGSQPNIYHCQKANFIYPCPSPTPTPTPYCLTWNWLASGPNLSSLEYYDCNNIFTIIPVSAVTNSSGSICVFPLSTPVWNPSPSIGTHILGTSSIVCINPTPTPTVTMTVTPTNTITPTPTTSMSYSRFRVLRCCDSIDGLKNIKFMSLPSYFLPGTAVVDNNGNCWNILSTSTIPPNEFWNHSTTYMDCELCIESQTCDPIPPTPTTTQTPSVTPTQTPTNIPTTQTVTACDSYTWPVNGLTYVSSGTYTSGIYTLILTINNSTTTSQSETSIGSYTWPVNGLTYTTSGTYVFVTTNPAGCPDTYILFLTIT